MLLQSKMRTRGLWEGLTLELKYPLFAITCGRSVHEFLVLAVVARLPQTECPALEPDNASPCGCSAVQGFTKMKGLNRGGVCEVF